jgi:3-keto-disaccharide hydrolase
MHVSRRSLIATAAAFAAVTVFGERTAASEESVAFDFTRPLQGWETIAGQWAVEDVPGASSAGKALVQRATKNDFNVIIAPGGPYDNIDVSVRFKPISGREDASGGIVFRFADGHYYVVRANALEDNFNLYYYEPKSLLAGIIGGRHYMTGVSVNAPKLGQWHELRVTAVADRIKAWLNGRQLIEYSDSRFASGRIGLWTKADSITAFDAPVLHRQ